MNSQEKIRDIVLHDKETKSQAQLKIQRSIEHTIDRENYEWKTIRVEKGGQVQNE